MGWLSDLNTGRKALKSPWRHHHHHASPKACSGQSQAPPPGAEHYVPKVRGVGGEDGRDGRAVQVRHHRFFG